MAKPMRGARGLWVATFGLSLLFSCSKPPETTSPQREPSKSEPNKAGLQTAEPAALAAPSAAAAQPSTQAVAAVGQALDASAALGKPAPGFSLKDLNGQAVSLSQFAGKTVVLEWFNPGCPFVQRAHTKGSLKGLAERHTGKGTVWLAINSGAPGKQGHGVELNRKAAAEFGMAHPILLDEDGTVGKSYGAKHTPHLFIINPQGVLVYRGAIDNSPDGEGESPTGGKLVNHVDAALSDLAAQKPVQIADTQAYGCGVKYASN